MSGKSARKIKLPSLQREPRATEVLQREYQDICTRVGQLQYQNFVNTREIEKMNEDLLSINHEAAARQKLDAEAKEKPSES